MSSGSTRGGAERGDADRRILRHLSTTKADYPALIASNTGLHIPLVERRCAALDEDGLLELVSGEVLYRITDYGRTAAHE